MKVKKFNQKDFVGEVVLDEDTKIQSVFDLRDDEVVEIKSNFIVSKHGINSQINIKAVVRDNAHFDFEGILKIVEGASNTNSYLKINCLIVGENASARAVPSLEIVEDEVKAGHGATIGYLALDQLEYLMSRGLNRDESEEVLINAFLNSN